MSSTTAHGAGGEDTPGWQPGGPEGRGPQVTVSAVGPDGALDRDVAAAEVVGVPVHPGPAGAEIAPGLPERLVVGDGALVVSVDLDHARRARFTGAVGQTLATLSSGGAGPGVVLVGLGPPAAVDADTVRLAAAAFVRASGAATSVALLLPAGLVDEAGSGDAVGVDPSRAAYTAGRAAAEAAVLATYRFTAHRSEAGRRGGGPVTMPTVPAAVHLVAVGDVDTEGLAAGAAAGRRVASAVWFARDLVNEPPSSLTPSRLAAAVDAELAGSPGVTLDVWDEERITAERLGGLLGVARGSAEPPRLLRASYEPADPVEVDGRVPHLVLVGKGITFDSGGLSLKSAGGMTTMKTDMSGAAAVLAAISACGDLGVRVRVTALAPVTENMPGGRAIKPGDVLRARNGKTIEVLNTDAEGRLVLADALSLAAELEPDAIVDLATLTGACVVALGTKVAGIFGTDDGVVARVRAASARAGERLWPLPLPDEYRSHIDSEIADMKNVGKDGQAGAIAAAMLLAEFVADVPWAHLDIAGPARSDEDSGLLAKGGTGFGVRTLVALAEDFGPGR